MRLFDTNDIALADLPAHLLYQFFDEGLIDSHTGGEKYRTATHDVILSRTISPGDEVPDLALTGYVFPSRWNRLVREYIDFPQLIALKEQIDKKSYPYSEYLMTFAAKFASHTHTKGGCLINLTFRIPRPTIDIPRMNVFSRSTFFIPVGVLDLTLITMIGRYLFGQKPFKLNWFMSQLQLSGWRMMPFVYGNGMKEALLKTTHPATEKLRRNMEFAFDHAHDMPYLDRQKYLMPVRFSKSLWKVEAGLPPYRPTGLGIENPLAVGEVIQKMK